MKAIKKTIQAAVIGLTSLAALGCGSSGSSNNDQGTTFTLYGFYSDVACGTGLAGTFGPLSIDSETSGSGTGPIAYAGLQNNLLSQGIRVRRVFYKFYVDGATTQPPVTNAPLGIVLGPAGSNGNGSLPGNFGGGSTTSGGSTSSTGSGTSLGCLGFQVVPTDILSYISLNRSSFPELPFTLHVEVTFNGITTAGDELYTNPLDFFVQFTADNIITPGTSTSSTSSTGAESVDETTTGDSTTSEGSSSTPTTTDDNTQL